MITWDMVEGVLATTKGVYRDCGETAQTNRDIADRLNILAGQPYRKLQMVADDLFLLCRRASYALFKGRAEDAAEILSHAKRIALQAGVLGREVQMNRREACEERRHARTSKRKL